MLHKDGIRRSIQLYRRRLQKRQEEQARKGINTPPEVLMEIEDIEVEIARLEEELKREPVEENQITNEAQGKSGYVSPAVETPDSSIAIVSDVFISYNEADRTWVEQELLPRLRAADIQFIAKDDFIPGTKRRVSISQAVKSSKHTLAILSQDFVDNNWDGLATEIALNLDPIALQRKLLPLLLGKCQLPETITDLSLIYLDFTNRRNWEHEFERLIRAIRTPP